MPKDHVQDHALDESNIDIDVEFEDNYFIDSATDFILSKNREYVLCMACHTPMFPGNISICPECLEQEADSFSLIFDEDETNEQY